MSSFAGSSIITNKVSTSIDGYNIILPVSDEKLRLELAPTLGIQISFTISGTDAGSGALAAGYYKLRSDVACWFRVNTSTGGTAAAVETDPCELLMAGEWSRLVTVTANGEIRAITSGGTGKLGYRTAT